MENNMNKEKIVVPSGVRYIGEWKEYRLEDYAFPHILNKVLTGCGFTEYCISNQQNLILVSPRKFLLENKEDQHPDEVYYVRNEIGQGADYERNILDGKSYKEKKSKLTDEEIKKHILNLKQGIRDYCYKVALSGKPKKILVTYDSFRHVKEVLTEMGVFQNYQVVVDEFQSIFIDSRFKADSEIELLFHIKDVQKLCYVSATPMLDKYLDMLDEFKNLPYYELDWTSEDINRVKKPDLDIKFTRSISEEANKVIRNYQDGKFEQRLNSDTGGISESREATIFMNSVKNICQAIRTNNLHLEECNVLCARTQENERQVKSAFNDVLKKEHPDDLKPPRLSKGVCAIGKIPKRGEPHKMFTFCTRTVYLGADFYSTNSRTFVFGDSNIECLSVDISMDLEQILGRQRLDENPWKNSANVYIKTTSGKNKLTQEDFDNFIKTKVKQSNNLLKIYDDSDLERKEAFIKTLYALARLNSYKDDYVSVNQHSGNKPVPVFNNLVLVSEMRAFEVQQIDYKDRFSVINTLKDKGIVETNETVKEAVSKFESITNTVDRLKFLVSFTTNTNITKGEINGFLYQIPSKYGEYYRLLGPDRIKANGYLETRIRNEWLKMNSEVTPEDDMITKIYSTFKKGEKYGNQKIKIVLKEIYSEFNFDKTAKAQDLDLYFVIKKTKALEDGKWVHGLEILGKR